MPTEQRAVSGFDQVHMRDIGDLDIVQGAEEALTVEADAEVLPKVVSEVRDGILILRLAGGWLERLSTALSAGLSAPHIHYRLTLKNLTGLVVAGAGKVTTGELKAAQLQVEISGAGQVACQALSVERLEVKLRGAGEVTCQALNARQLEVTLSGAGRIDLAGKVQEQRAVLSGAGAYVAGRLESQQAQVTMSGAGSASVWAAQSLDATLSGLGSVEYYGSPRLRQRITGLGSIRPMRAR